MKLLVWFPGLGSFANVTGNVLEYFERDLDTDVLCVSYDRWGLAGPTVAAERLLGPLEAILDQYDMTFFLCHSMGGHVASKLITTHNLKPSKLVTIASPLAFSRWPLLNNWALIKDLQNPTWPTDVPTLHIYGSLDLLANPASPLISEQRTTQANEVSMGVRGHEHLSVLWSPRTAAELYAFCTYT